MDYIQYLALSDLLKVREQLSDTAACLCDDSFELRGNEMIVKKYACMKIIKVKSNIGLYF